MSGSLPVSESARRAAPVPPREGVGVGSKRPAAGLAFIIALACIASSFAAEPTAPSAAAPAATVAPAAKPSAAEPPIAVRVAKVVSVDDKDTVINNAIVLVRDGKIEKILSGADAAVPDGYRVYDFPGNWLVPGLVEAHNHCAAGGWSDLNDMVYQTNPGLTTTSVPQADADWAKLARTGGVTTAIMIPGSGTNISGMGTLVSFGGHTPDEITMRAPGSLKIAQAGNPEWYFGGNGRSFMNWNTRQTLTKARDYNAAWEKYERGETKEKPEYSIFWEPFRPLMQHKIPATVHTQIYQVVLTTVRMVHDEFGLWTVTDHSTFDAWKLGPVTRDTDIWTVCGPRCYYPDNTARRMIGIACGWWKNGVRRIGINTDSPVIPEEELPFQAAMNCWYGFLPYPALKAVTNVPAKALGVYDKVGSIEVGKQADFAVWTGDPIDPRSACLLTVVRGEVAYDATRDCDTNRQTRRF